MQVKHERGFHFTSVAEAAWLRLADRFHAVGSNRPVRSKDELRLRKITFQLAQGDAQRHIVATVAIEQKDLLPAHLLNGMAKFNDELDVRHLPDAQRSREKQVVRRMPRPQCRQAKDFIGSFLLEPPRDGGNDVRVGGEWQMRAMLVAGANREELAFPGQPSLP